MRRLLAVLLLAAAPAAFAQCEPLPSPLPAAGFLGAPARSIADLHAVFDRIAEVAGFRPTLMVCPDQRPNAFAKEAEGQLVLGITTGLLKLAETPDELAAVVGHEFGHFEMRHREARMKFARDAYLQAHRDAQRMLRQGATTNAAVRRAATGFLDQVSSFSRIAEREADDDGFRLMMKAGFRAAGARALNERMIKVYGSGQRGYFASHPGLGERAQYSQVLEENERFRATAEALVERHDTRGLKAHVAAWAKQVPASGAASFYQAVAMRWEGRSAAEIAPVLEEAVAKFDGEGLSKLSQGYQPEADSSALAYCTLLYTEGRTVQTLHCLESLEPREVELFRRATGWTTFILTARRARSPDSNALHVARAGKDGVLLSNCSQTVNVNGMRIARAWSPAREGRPSTEPAARYLRCDPGTCNCAPVTDAATLEAIRAAFD